MQHHDIRLLYAQFALKKIDYSVQNNKKCRQFGEKTVC